MKRYPLIGASGLQVGKSVDLANVALFLMTKATEVATEYDWVLMKFGEGNLTWTLSQEPVYELNRKELDDVSKGNASPLEVTFEGKATFVASSGTEPHTVHEILTGYNFATGAKQFYGTPETWLSEYGCPPYCCQLEFHSIPQLECPLSSALGEATLFRYFRASSIGWDTSSKRVSVRGMSHVKIPFVQRFDFAAAYAAELGDEVLTEGELVPLKNLGGTWPDDPRAS